jgi:hypothetical protein
MSLAAIVFALLTSIGPHIEVGEDGTGRFGTGHGRPDALFASSQGLAVAWTESIPPEIDGSGGNVCHVSGIAEEEPSLGDAGPSDREILREVSSQALCCVDRTVVEPVGRGGFLAVTTCSTSHGFWIWSQTLSADGRPSQLPAPVFPVPGRGQHAPALAPSDRGTLWLAWLEGGQEAGVARAARVDASGALLNGPFDLSDEGDGVVLAEPLRDGLTIVPLADGGLAAAWNEFSGREPKGIHFRLFDVSGNPLTNEIQATPDDHESAESPRMVVVERTGPVVLVWRKRSSDPNASTRIYFRMFSRSGEALSDALPVAVDEPDRSQVRSTFVIDKAGVLRHVHYGVNPRGHANEIFDVIRRLKS